MSEYIAKCNEVVGISGKTLIVPDYIDTSKEIVRCRDCAYFDGEPDMESMGEKCWRDPSHSGRSMPTVADGFCWRGKRKEGDE